MNAEAAAARSGWGKGRAFRVVVAVGAVAAIAAAVAASASEAFGIGSGGALVAAAAAGASGCALFAAAARDRRRDREVARLDAALTASERRFASMFEQAGAGVAELGIDGRIRAANRKFCTLLGRSRADLLDSSFLDLALPSSGEDRVRCDLGAAAREGRPFEARFLRGDGREVWARAFFSLVDDDAPYFFAMVEDVTDRVEAKRQTEVTAERLRLALEAADMGAWDWDLRDGRPVWSERCREIFGFPSGFPVDYAAFVARQHPDDRARVAAAAARAMDPEGDGYFEDEYRVLLPDGAIRWVASFGQVLFERNDGGRRPMRFVGVMEDATERKEAQRALEIESERHRLAVEIADLGAWRWDFGKQEAVWSDRCRDIFGVDRDAPVPMTLGLDLLHPDDRARAGAAFAQAMDPEGDGVFVSEDRAVLPDSSIRWVVGRGQAFFADGPEGRRVESFLGVVQDVTARKEIELRLEKALADASELLAQRETLLREIHHRVKNNLQVILSLIRIQIRRLGARDGAEELEMLAQRVAAIGRLHERLYSEGDLAQVDFGAYLRSLCDSVAELYGRREIAVRVDAAPLACDIDVAAPLGLLANELITNAFKHAFPNRAGTVRVTLARDGKESVRLSVADDGVGAPDGVESGGVGSTLVQALSRQIRAETTTRIGDGVEVSVILPAHRFAAATDRPAPPELEPA